MCIHYTQNPCPPIKIMSFVLIYVPELHFHLPNIFVFCFSLYMFSCCSSYYSFIPDHFILWTLSLDNLLWVYSALEWTLILPLAESQVYGFPTHSCAKGTKGISGNLILKLDAFKWLSSSVKIGMWSILTLGILSSEKYFQCSMKKLHFKFKKQNKTVSKLVTEYTFWNLLAEYVTEKHQGTLQTLGIFTISTQS